MSQSPRPGQSPKSIPNAAKPAFKPAQPASTPRPQLAGAKPPVVGTNRVPPKVPAPPASAPKPMLRPPAPPAPKPGIPKPQGPAPKAPGPSTLSKQAPRAPMKRPDFKAPTPPPPAPLGAAAGAKALSDAMKHEIANPVVIKAPPKTFAKAVVPAKLPLADKNSPKAGAARAKAAPGKPSPK